MMPDLSSLPECPESVPLSEEHRTLLTGAFAAAQPEISELTFAYLYVWRTFLNCRLARHGDSLLILVDSERDAASYYLPPVTVGNQAAVIREILAASGGLGIADSFARVPAGVAGELEDDDDKLECVGERGRADYVYLASDLQELPAARYHNKRNLIRQFHAANPSAHYSAMDAALAERCIGFCRRWQQDHPMGDSSDLRKEVDVVCLMLKHHDWLGLKGGAILREDELLAFSLGEAINETTLAIRAEKAEAGLRGAYQVINQEFARHAGAGFQFINRESDMGVPGLRRAKQSYYPHHLVEKFRVRLR